MRFDTPERCLLAQAALFVLESIPPMPDEVYLSSPRTSVGNPHRLVYGLRSGQLVAEGALRHAYRSGSRYYGEARDHKDIPLQFSSPLAAPTAWVSIPAELWIAENISIEMSQLKVEDDVAKKLYNVERPDKDYILFVSEAGFIPKIDFSASVETLFLFNHVRIHTDGLFRLFPQQL